MTNDASTFQTTSPKSRTTGPAKASRVVSDLELYLDQADVQIDGGRPWDLRVADPRLYSRFAAGGLLGLGESYVDGWWDCDAIDQLFDRCHTAGIWATLPVTPSTIVATIRNRVFNRQRPAAAMTNVQSHYQGRTDLFRATLGKSMIYSCGYWKNASSLVAAQEAKLDLICRKLHLQSGQRVLDIGCGWGGFAKFAADRYDVNVVGITLSADELGYASEDCRNFAVDFRLQDYRDIDEKFDAVVSMGMVEHVGPKNLRTFMDTAHRCLTDDGLCLLHFCCGQQPTPSIHDGHVLWMNKFIFPGWAVPSMAQVSTALEGLFVLEDLHNYGADYDLTLTEWFANFDRNWPSLRPKYGQNFYKLWKYYLLSCAGTFRARKIQSSDWVLSKNGIIGGYRSVR